MVKKHTSTTQEPPSLPNCPSASAPQRWNRTGPRDGGDANVFHRGKNEAGQNDTVHLVKSWLMFHQVANS